jgi:hypothetical protein
LPSAPTPFVQRPSASTAFHPNVRDGRETPLDSKMEQNRNIKAMRGGVKGEAYVRSRCPIRRCRTFIHFSKRECGFLNV